jgi:hypothetical protein
MFTKNIWMLSGRKNVRDNLIRRCFSLLSSNSLIGSRKLDVNLFLFNSVYIYNLYHLFIISFCFSCLEASSLRLVPFISLIDSLPSFCIFVTRLHLLIHDLNPLFVAQIYNFFPYISHKITKP